MICTVAQPKVPNLQVLHVPGILRELERPAGKRLDSGTGVTTLPVLGVSGTSLAVEEGNHVSLRHA